MSYLFPYVGSKTALAAEINKYIPAHKCFVEVFGGSAAVLLSRRPSEVEVYNDLDCELTNFLMALRQAGSYRPVMDKLTWLCQSTPMSRKLYETWLHEWKVGIKPQDPIERAAVWYFLASTCINMFGGGWTHSSTVNEAVDWQRHVNLLPKAVERFLNVQIECKDFAYIIKTYDGIDTLFYLDPPYIGVKGVAAYYDGAPPMTEDRHRELAQLLSQIKGKAIVSYYPHPVVDCCYPEDKWVKMAINQVKGSNSVAKGVTKGIGKELLLFNFEPMPLFFRTQTAPQTISSNFLKS